MDYSVQEKLRSKQMVVRYLSKSGKARFKGGSDLKRSQSYPARSLIRLFGKVFLGTGGLWKCFVVWEFLIYRWWYLFSHKHLQTPATKYVFSHKFVFPQTSTNNPGSGMHLPRCDLEMRRRTSGWPRSFWQEQSVQQTQWMLGSKPMACGRNMLTCSLF